MPLWHSVRCSEKRRQALLGSNLPRDSQGERGEAGIAKRPQMFTERPGGGESDRRSPPQAFFPRRFCQFLRRVSFDLAAVVRRFYFQFKSRTFNSIENTSRGIDIPSHTIFAAAVYLRRTLRGRSQLVSRSVIVKGNCCLDMPASVCVITRHRLAGGILGSVVRHSLHVTTIASWWIVPAGKSYSELPYAATM